MPYPPVIIASLQSITLSSTSNVLSQILSAYSEQRPITFDAGQLIRFMILAVITTPPNFYWQMFLERSFPSRIQKHAPGYRSIDALEMEERKLGDDKKHDDIDKEEEKPALNIRNTALKWFIDCMTMGALLNTTAFLVIMGALKGKTVDEIITSVQTDLIPIILASYRLWPIASIVNFSLIPAEKRIVFLSAVGLVWGIYMSLVAARV